jgi:hypothetical protein
LAAELARFVFCLGQFLELQNSFFFWLAKCIVAEEFSDLVKLDFAGMDDAYLLFSVG